MDVDRTAVEMVVEWLPGDAQRYEWFEATAGIGPVASSKEPPPFPYGCIPGALSPGDGELLDVFLLDGGSPHPGEVVPVRLVGVLIRSDGDHKLLAVDARRPAPRTLAEVDETALTSIWHWMRRHVRLHAAGHEVAYQVLSDARRAWLVMKGD